ncbi:MAG: DUF2141 domain-containing protein [Pseudomonadota bacterium]
MRKMIGKSAALAAASPLLIGASPLQLCNVHIELDNMRSTKGLVHLCLTANERHFPDCDNDPKARRITVEAASGKALFSAIPSGDYAIAIVHDENGNSRLDKFAGIPREGIGFSRNPKFTFGPPKFRKALFSATPVENRERIRVKYYL